MKKQLLKIVYSVGGFRPFQYLYRNEVLVLTYHRFSEQSGKLSVSKEEFEQHLIYLAKHFNVLSLEDVILNLESGIELPKNTAVVTIDDGYRDAFEIAFPLLRKYNLPATLYVISDFLDGKIWLWTDKMRYVLLKTGRNEVDIKFENGVRIHGSLNGSDSRLELAGHLNDQLKRLPDALKELKIIEIASEFGVVLNPAPPAEYGPISWDQAREMDKNGVSIECHTVTHPIMTNIDTAQREIELKGSKTVIENELGREVRHFCYPNGSFDQNVRDAVETAGFASAVTTNYGFCDNEEDRFTMHRINGQPGIVEFVQSVSGFESIRMRIGI